MQKHLTKKSYARERPVLYNRPIGGEAWVMGVDYPEVASRCRAGHFVMLSVGPGIHPVLPRPFSVYRLLDEEGRPFRPTPTDDARATGVFWRGCRGFEVLYKVVGDGTERLARKLPGDGVGVMGPCGDSLYAPVFPGDEVPGYVLMVAGGVGIVPVYLSALELGPLGVPHHLFFGGRGKEYLYGHEDFVPLGTVLHLSTQDGSLGETGLVTDDLRRFLEEARGRGSVDGRPFASGAIYACGPEGMLRVVQKVGRHFGLPAHLSLERRMGCAMGACRGCVVRVVTGDGSPAYERVCTEGPVFEGGRILL